jgi:hypothetical protein
MKTSPITIIKEALKSGRSLSEGKLIEKVEAEGFTARGAKVALTRFKNYGELERTETGSYFAHQS